MVYPLKQMSELGKLLVVVGLLIAGIGALLWAGVGHNWLGKLPGDIRYTSPEGHFSFYFPIVTCVLASLILTIILWFLKR